MSEIEVREIRGNVSDFMAQLAGYPDAASYLAASKRRKEAYYRSIKEMHERAEREGRPIL